jgi:hypothetical protein
LLTVQAQRVLHAHGVPDLGGHALAVFLATQRAPLELQPRARMAAVCGKEPIVVVG